jgi:hypothetical protein
LPLAAEEVVENLDAGEEIRDLGFAELRRRHRFHHVHLEEARDVGIDGQIPQ